MKVRLWCLSNFSVTPRAYILRKDRIYISAFRPAPLLKSDSHLPKKMDVSCSIENPLIMMKNAFYFILKSLFVLKIFKFLSRLFGHVGNSLIRKISLTSKFMTSLLGLQTIAIHIFPNISQSKGNQTMKFGELIEYNKRNIFL